MDRLTQTSTTSAGTEGSGGGSRAAGRSSLTSRLHRRARDNHQVASDAGAAVDGAAASSGAALPGDVQSRFESSLGADLSGVRVHTGEASAAANDSLGARAYAHGNDIHFGANQYNPGDPFGLHLIAHEVAHTVQQRGGAPTTQHKLEVSSPGDAAEVAADRAADAMVGGWSAAGLLDGHAPGIQRHVEGDGRPAQPADKAPSDQPAAEPELAKVKARWDDANKCWTYSDVHYSAVKGKAFVGGVAVKDVNQGMVGDCYLMSALISLAAQSPAVIEGLISDAGPDKWTVRLYAKQPDGSFKPFSYTVDNQFATVGTGGAMAYGHSNQQDTKKKSMGWTYVDNTYNDPMYDFSKIPKDAEKKENFVEIPDDEARELWPAIIEKAYAMHAPQLGKKQEGARAGGYDDIGEGDGSNVAMEALMGKPATATDMGKLGGDALFKKINAALAAHQPVTAGTPDAKGQPAREKLATDSTVYSDHAYAVMSITQAQVVLRNPWGHSFSDDDIKARDDLKKLDNNGTVTMTLDEFRKRFDAVYVGNDPTPTN